jgi:hypothetical protein
VTALESFNQAALLIQENPSLAHFYGAASPESIDAAERFLDVTFPASYRAFLEKFGVGSFYGAEFYGVVNGKVPGSSVPSIVWTTLDDRKHPAYPATFVTIMSTGYGPLVCFDAADGEEPSIVLWHAGMAPGERPEFVAESFGDFFLSETTQCLNDFNT